MLNTDQLLAQLEENGIRNVDIARVLGLPDSRIPEIRRKQRALKLDEAFKLAQAFGLAPKRPAQVLPDRMMRLAIRYVLLRAGVQPEESLLQELSQDIEAFVLYAMDPEQMATVEGAEGFFRAMLVRPANGQPATRETAAEAPLGSDPHRAD